MAATYGLCLYHVVFSTKSRQRMIASSWRPRLLAYVGGIAHENDFTLLGAGGVEDHVHLLLSIPPSMAPAKAVQLVKGGSSKWAKDAEPGSRGFAWQSGYGIFTFGFSQLEASLHYVNNQERHHHRKTFEEEYREFLEKHRIEYVEDYLFD